MDIFTSVGILLLAATIHATLQLGQGVFLILHHASSTRYFSSKIKNLTGSFVSGVGLTTFFGLSAICFLLFYLAYGLFPSIVLIVIVSLLALLAIFMWFFYYRHGHSTELWLPKPIARYITARARSTHSNTEAFSLGILTCVFELPISAILLVLAASSILALPAAWQLLSILIYTLFVVAPLFVMQLAFRRGKTVVDIQRWRLRNKNFLRIISGIGFIVLAIFVFTFEVFA